MKTFVPSLSILALVVFAASCQKAPVLVVDPESPTTDPLSIVLSFSVSDAALVPDPIDWNTAHDSSRIATPCAGLVCTDTLKLSRPLGSDTIHVRTWTRGLRTGIRSFLASDDGTLNELPLVQSAADSNASRLLKAFATWSQAHPESLSTSGGKGQGDLVSYYASRIVAQDPSYPRFPSYLPVGMALDSAKKAVVLGAAKASWTAAALAKTGWGMDSTEIRRIVDGLASTGSISAKETDNLYPLAPPPPPDTVAAPGISPAGGNYTSRQVARFTNNRPDASLHCTLDGSTPDGSSPACPDSVQIRTSMTVSVVAVRTGSVSSPVVRAEYTLAPRDSTLATLYTSPGTLVGTFVGGTTTYRDSVPSGTGSVTVSAVPSNPGDIDSVLFGEGIDPVVKLGASDPTTITVRVVNRNRNPLRYTLEIYHKKLDSTATPTFLPAAGYFATAPAVSIQSKTSGADIYYTTDGTEPTENSAKYGGAPLQLAGGRTLKALAIAPGKATSGIASAVYVVGTVAGPTFSPVAGTYSGAQSVTLSSATAGATIYYTTDGSKPTTASLRYTGPIGVPAGTTVTSIAVADGMANSPINAASYVIGTAATPTFSPPGGSYASVQTVSVSSTTAGAKIYFTTDGSAPSTASTAYDGTPVTISAGQVLQAVAVKQGMSTSATGSATYTIGTVATPQFSPPGGTYASTQSVELKTTTAGATIYYTTDGSTPSTSSTRYAGTAISLPEGRTISAIATASGMAPSQMGAATYMVGTVATPTFSKPSGPLDTGTQITIACATSGARIRYTTDGTAPLPTSPVQLGPISVNKRTILRAIAEKAGVATSAEGSATYEIFGRWVDARDGQSYKTVTIGTQTWFAKNLAYAGDTSVIGTCYADSASNCAIFGRLYSWAEAMALDDSMNLIQANLPKTPHQGICPPGSHVPTKEDWRQMTATVPDPVGTNLKSRTGWPDGEGTDLSGFGALPGGVQFNGTYAEKGVTNQWWTASEGGPTSAYVEYVKAGQTNWFEYGNVKPTKMALRCLLDTP